MKGCYTHVYHSRPYFLSLGQTHSVNMSFKLQNRSRCAEISVNLLRNTGRFRLDGNNGFEQFQVHCIVLLERLQMCVENLAPRLQNSFKRALKMVTQRGLSAKTLPSSSPLALALLVCSVSHVWPI